VYISITPRLDAIQNQFDTLQTQFDAIQSQTNAMRSDISEIKDSLSGISGNFTGNYTSPSSVYQLAEHGVVSISIFDQRGTLVGIGSGFVYDKQKWIHHYEQSCCFSRSFILANIS
jgi:prefoldin subunit 5